ncbi:hypothetical protein [Deinococcus fonticola]|uniref:hypothetical protein n=1 Tax=Deinococcus fonticola TaxID=2528713 RepID=UPI001074FEC3|nr:hypothetical protein [Deinococcus fonticola]
MNLINYANNLAGSPLHPLVRAQLTRSAAQIAGDTGSTLSHKAWAVNALRYLDDGDARLAVAVVLTNPTIAATVDEGGLPSDSDLEYVIINSVLPLILPA